ncbi:MAG: hypothetical protein K2K26_01065 [Muribaculaceae bacterium]|nr:hypothetical protein [Muribaculaceae bacterium]
MTLRASLMTRRFSRTFLIIAIILPIALALTLPIFAQDKSQADISGKPAITHVEKFTEDGSHIAHAEKL